MFTQGSTSCTSKHHVFLSDFVIVMLLDYHCPFIFVMSTKKITATESIQSFSGSLHKQMGSYFDFLWKLTHHIFYTKLQNCYQST